MRQLCVNFIKKLLKIPLEHRIAFDAKQLHENSHGQFLLRCYWQVKLVRINSSHKL